MHSRFDPYVGDDALRGLNDILTVRLVGRRDGDRGYTVPAADRGGRVTRRPAMAPRTVDGTLAWLKPVYDRWLARTRPLSTWCTHVWPFHEREGGR